jgi:hypothetical protein
MKITLTTSEAVHRLLADEYAGWTYAGANALVEYMEELEESCGEEMTFCNVALRCDWTEYATALEAAKAYGFEVDDEDADEDEQEGAALVYLQRNTTVLEFRGGVVVQDY